MNQEDRLRIYEIPDGVGIKRDFSVFVNLDGTEEWREARCYEVKVDMHEIRRASMAYFDFEGKINIKIRFNNYMDIYQVDIRPKSRKIIPVFTEREIYFSLEHPENLSIEVNRDRFHNLHLFAGKIQESVPDTTDKEVRILKGDLQKPVVHSMYEMDRFFKETGEGRTLFFEPGIHYFEECILKIPSETDIYIAGGAVIVGSFVCDGINKVKIWGRGVVYQACFGRFSSLRGVRVSKSCDVIIEGITFINPPHYTVYIGGSESITVRNIKSFSCEGWSDGIDVMSSSNILIENVFMRNSDDCIALYGRRWEYNGDTRDILVRHSTLWADVAHPTNIGCHGDYESEGNVIEHIVFTDIDILEHHEPQKQCQGCMCINAGDKNTVRNVKYKNIRIESIEYGKLLDIQLICGRYNQASGKGIENIFFEDIFFDGYGERTSEIKGIDEKRYVRNIMFDNLVIRGEKAVTASQANIHVSEYAYNVSFG
ncbi:MAG: right-handed parallel beta-helix repeat-containing protein [Lachnospiraceae bacterium]|nr:right-handed parallel beta-helix repeat-containing protein [Lachnospiraceae bacterium]